MIYAWERGDHQLTERYELLYAAVLAVSQAQLASGPGAFGEPAAGAEHGWPARHTPSSGASPWELADALTRSSVSMTALDFMERSVNALAARYPFTAPSDLTPGVHAMLARVHDALGQPQPAKVRTRCVRLGGILCGVAGQLADDTGRHDQAVGYFKVGELAGTEAGDPGLIAWVLAIRSIGHFFRREYVRSAELITRADAAAGGSTARRRAWLAVLSARAHAALADQRGDVAANRSDVMRAVERAYADVQTADGPPSGTDFFDKPRLDGMAGTTLLLLRDTRGARELLGSALAHRAANDFKGRALLMLDLAECMAMDGEPERSAELAGGALDTVGDGVVLPVAVRARAIRSILQPWERTRAVRELDGRLAELPEAGREG
jgi:hypothetical protein